jgi:phosphoglucomutase
MLRELHGTDPRYNLGYVTDNDGDRANIVVYDAQIGAVRSIQAQELFALVCMVELAWLVHTGRVTYDGAGHVRERVALVANGPTSLRVDRIAEAFGVELFRAEVGEANAVSLARALRRQGYVVRVLGEGSNGGSIIEPGEVRDPLATLGALLKLLYTPDLSGSTANDLFHIWCERWGSAELYRQDYTLSEVIDSLPPFRTTGTAEARAKVDIGGADPEALKSAYARLVSTHWEELRSALEPHLEIHRWEIVHHRGTDELHGARKPAFGYTSPGGFKVILKNSTGRHVGFAWMRGSGTEPVFRVIADTEGADERAEQLLLNWHSDLVRKAARSAEEFSGKPETPST